MLRQKLESMKLGGCRHRGARLHSNMQTNLSRTPWRSARLSSSLGTAGGSGRRASSLDPAGESSHHVWHSQRAVVVPAISRRLMRMQVGKATG